MLSLKNLFILLSASLFLIGCKARSEQKEPELPTSNDLPKREIEVPPYDFPYVPALVDFSDVLREWDGFGFNYVETAQTMNYDSFPQEYGGFSLLDEQEKEEIVDMVFGEDGLKVGLVKMFLDPHHQKEPDGPFDHRKTTAYMREFVKKGLEKTRARGADFNIITTLYGPPAYATQQKVMRGRDLDPDHKEDVAAYIIDWAKFLIEEEELPLKYVSLHNEGEDWHRWTNNGYTDWPGHDYNMFWPPEQVADFLSFMPAMVKEAGLSGVQVTNGEPSNWYRFGTWGHSDGILYNPEALQNLGIISSHGFYGGTYGEWFGEHKSTGIDELRKQRPDLKAWVTSTSWSNMDARNIKEMHGNIYTAKVNAIIPWAGIQLAGGWVKGDPNPGCAFQVYDNGTYEVRRGYHFYKQISRAGQPGTGIARTMAMDSEIAIIGFSSNNSGNPDAVVVVNIDDEARPVALQVAGSKSKHFEGYRTTLPPGADKNTKLTEAYQPIGEMELNQYNQLKFEAPAGSVTTFYGK
jgi:hypothetical protein